MNVAVRRKGKVAILDISGRVVIGEALYTLRSTIREVLNEGFKYILINMAGVNYVDSSGIGELVSGYTTVSTQGGRLRLVKTTERVTNLLHMTKLLTVFECFTSERDALKSFEAENV